MALPTVAAEATAEAAVAVAKRAGLLTTAHTRTHCRAQEFYAGGNTPAGACVAVLVWTGESCVVAAAWRHDPRAYRRTKKGS